MSPERFLTCLNLLIFAAAGATLVFFIRDANALARVSPEAGKAVWSLFWFMIAVANLPSYPRR